MPRPQPESLETLMPHVGWTERATTAARTSLAARKYRTRRTEKSLRFPVRQSRYRAPHAKPKLRLAEGILDLARRSGSSTVPGSSCAGHHERHREDQLPSKHSLCGEPHAHARMQPQAVIRIHSLASPTPDVTTPAVVTP